MTSEKAVFETVFSLLVFIYDFHKLSLHFFLGSWSIIVSDLSHEGITITAAGRLQGAHGRKVG
jgi:hypothetical protein